MATCRGPAIDEKGKQTRCDREARAEGLCMSHYRQALRCRARDEDVILSPLTERGNPRAALRLRVSARCLETLEAAARAQPKATVSSVARDWLEARARAEKPARSRR